MSCVPLVPSHLDTGGSNSEKRAEKRHILDGKDGEGKQHILAENVHGAQAPQASPKPKELSPKEEKEASKRYGHIF